MLDFLSWFSNCWGLLKWQIFGIQIAYIYYVLIALALVYVNFMFILSKQKFSKLIQTQFWFILIWGKFNAWKTRLLTQMASEVYEIEDTFVISNFFNWYSFLQYSSFDDFIRLLDDLLLLWEYQNFTEQERNKIKNKFWKYFNQKIIDLIATKYPRIPKNWYNSRFILQWDEFHQYLYNRNSMGNFSGENWKKLLQTLHQVRHYNTLLILATQDIEELDLKLRKLASYEIDTLNYFWIFFGLNFYRFYLNKRQTQKAKDEKAFNKLNKMPVLYFNNYVYNTYITAFENFYNNFRKKRIKRYNKLFKKNVLFVKKEFQRKKELDFETKFNVKIDVSIYKSWDLFKKLNEFYKNKKKNLTD